MRFDQIDQEVRRILREVWAQQNRLWPEQSLLPIQMLDIEAICTVLDVAFDTFDSGYTLRTYRGQKYKAAGILDRQANKIAIAHDLPYGVGRFTAGHECGHYVLHPNLVMHRDRPVNGANQLNFKRPREEVEADYFAACLLMPEKLLRHYIEAYFGRRLPFRFDDSNAFWFQRTDPDALARANSDSLDREFALATCTSYNGRHFDSLAKTFGVSDSAMAVRLKKLKLVEWP